MRAPKYPTTKMLEPLAFEQPRAAIIKIVQQGTLELLKSSSQNDISSTLGTHHGI